eukprot:jgi/Mesvir1/17652/Mv08868-RA.1
MRRDVYEVIRSRLHLGYGQHPPYKELCEDYPEIAYDTFECQRKARRTAAAHRREEATSEFLRCWLRGQDVLDICRQVDCAPLTMARCLLGKLFLACLNKREMSTLIRQPELLLQGALWAPADETSARGAHASAGPLAQAREEVMPPGAIDTPPRGTGDASDARVDEGAVSQGALLQPAQQRQRELFALACSLPPPLLARLVRDVERCKESDHIFAPRVETIKRVTGAEYEALLCERLRNLGAAFQTEEEMRARGFSKTPDVRLEVPLCVRGRVVHWVDSKAMFGDEYTLRTNNGDQFQKYIARFGPGMVIYWFGYITDLETPDDVLIVDDFPAAEDIVQLPRLY